MDRQIIYYYQRGVASYLIAKKFKVSNTYVRKLLERNNIKLRGHDITNKVSASRRTPEENKRITQAAAKANLGTTHTPVHRSRLALSRQQNPVIDPVYEQPLLNYFEKHGIVAVPQKAFYKYNVDLYLPKENIVIEIFGGGFHNKKEAISMFKNKLAYLSKKKIPVLVVWSDQLTYEPSKVAAVALNAYDSLMIITGDGKPSIRGLKDIT